MSVVAYFVSPHGFGHAARASAVMAALWRLEPEIELHVFTTVPRWFFDDSLRGPLVYHPLRTDVGLVQEGPFGEDLPATVAALASFWREMPGAAAETAAILARHRVRLVVSDISPLGLMAAERAGLPGVLVENFTWDWIYRGYAGEEPRLEEYARRSAEAVARARLRIQAEPVCRPAAEAVAVAPVGREPRAEKEKTRRLVGLAPGDPRPLVLMTMGGMGWRSEDGPDRARPRQEDAGGDAFVVTLGGGDSVHRSPGRLALPDRSPIFPPDLVRAADLVVAKLGYSTVAECYRAGARLLYLERPRFRESAVLARFCRRRLGARAVDRSTVEGADWPAVVSAALARPAPEAGAGSGAAEIARLLAERLA